MPNPDSLFQRFGGSSFPIDPANVSDSLTTLDPARSVLTNLFASAINSELTEVWQKVVGRTASPAITGQLPGGNSHALFDTLPVQCKLELDPMTAHMQQVKMEFPMLAVHRQGRATFEQHTIEQERRIQEWGVHYVLGPLSIEGLRKVADVCVAVANIIRLVIRQRGHKSYQDGALQFFGDTAALGAVELVDSEGPGAARFANDDTGILFYALSMTLRTSEYSSDIDVEAPLLGFDWSIGVGTATEILPGFIYIDGAVPFQQG